MTAIATSKRYQNIDVVVGPVLDNDEKKHDGAALPLEGFHLLTAVYSGRAVCDVKSTPPPEKPTSGSTSVDVPHGAPADIVTYFHDNKLVYVLPATDYDVRLLPLLPS